MRADQLLSTALRSERPKELLGPTERSEDRPHELKAEEGWRLMVEDGAKVVNSCASGEENE